MLPFPTINYLHSQQQKPILISQYCIISQGDQPVIWWQVDGVNPIPTDGLGQRVNIFNHWFTFLTVILKQVTLSQYVKIAADRILYNSQDLGRSGSSKLLWNLLDTSHAKLPKSWAPNRVTEQSLKDKDVPLAHRQHLVRPSGNR